MNPTSPQCPKCGGETVLRRAPQGPRAGTPFWGCAGFPACTGGASVENLEDERVSLTG